MKLIYTIQPTSDVRSKPYYLKIEDGDVRLYNYAMDNIGLTYIFADAAAITFALEMCVTEAECFKAIMLHLPTYKSGPSVGSHIWQIGLFDPLKGSR